MTTSDSAPWTRPVGHGLSAFPLTPVDDRGVDAASYAGLVERLAGAGVDSITALGSTGSYAYLDRAERRRALEVAIASSGSVPVIGGVGALRTRDVLLHVEDAQTVGVSALLLAPVSYQPLTQDEVFGLFEEVDRHTSIPIVVYDNPGTTHVVFTDELHAGIAQLGHVASIKIPPVSGGPAAVAKRVASLRAVLPPDVTIGTSGDPLAAEALEGGCDGWYSVLAGTLPAPCVAIARAAAAGEHDRAAAASARLRPLWDLFDAHGSYRVVAAVAEEIGLVRHPHLPRPVQGLGPGARSEVRAALHGLTGLFELG